MRLFIVIASEINYITNKKLTRDRRIASTSTDDREWVLWTLIAAATSKKYKTIKRRNPNKWSTHRKKETHFGDRHDDDCRSIAKSTSHRRSYAGCNPIHVSPKQNLRYYIYKYHITYYMLMYQYVYFPSYIYIYIKFLYIKHMHSTKRMSFRLFRSGPIPPVHFHSGGQHQSSAPCNMKSELSLYLSHSSRHMLDILLNRSPAYGLFDVLRLLADYKTTSNDMKEI